jgi:hypothetical protein
MGIELTEALLSVIKATAGFFIVMAVWLAIQAFARRRNGCAPDRDMLDYMLHGCGNCLHGGNCEKSKERSRIAAGPGAGTL